MPADQLELMRRLCDDPFLTVEEAEQGVALADDDDTELEAGDDAENQSAVVPFAYSPPTYDGPRRT